MFIVQATGGIIMSRYNSGLEKTRVSILGKTLQPCLIFEGLPHCQDEESSLKILSPGVNVIKPFSFVADDEAK
jgi:hypothetical protein